jgi:hypothetical protein
MEGQTAPPPQSLGTRIVNVFSSPAEAFDGITTTESVTTLWVAPMLTAMLLAAFFAFVIASDDVLKGQIIDMQSRSLQEQVDKGNITAEQAERQQDAMRNMGMLFAVIGSIGATVMIAVYYFCGSLVLWLVGRFAMKGAHGYTKYLAMYGTASWIAVLGAVVTGLMVIGMGSLVASPSAALAILNDYDPANTTHRLLTKVEVFAIWQTAVVGIGLSKMTGKSVGVGVGVAFALLVAWSLLTALLRFGM